MVNMAHIAGLVAASSNCSLPISRLRPHKTLRGPRGGFNLGNDEELAKKISSLFSLVFKGPLEHVIAAKALNFQALDHCLLRVCG